MASEIVVLDIEIVDEDEAVSNKKFRALTELCVDKFLDLCQYRLFDCLFRFGGRNSVDSGTVFTPLVS